MTDREKLMDMICESVQTDRCVGNCNHPHCNTVQIVCDHLLSKGVTIPVRCKDCKFYELKNYPDGIQRMCCENSEAIWTATPPDAFCSYGERKDNG